jgi:hypothetical protein
MTKILTLEEYASAIKYTKDANLSEKESPYDRETLINYKHEYEQGKKIPFGVKNSLIAQGMIAREGGKDEGKKKKSEGYGGPKEDKHAFTHWNGIWENQNK